MSARKLFSAMIGLTLTTLFLTACGAAAQTADTPVPPTDTPIPATAPPVPPTATPVPPTATPAPAPTTTPVPTPVPPTPVTYSEASGWFFDTDSSAVTRVKVVDLNDDSQPEVVVAATKMIYALDYTGSLLWEYELPSTILDLVIADIDDDNSPDIFAGGSLHDVMLDSEGNEIWFHDFSSYEAASFLRNYAADMDGDGTLEVGYLHPSAVAVFSGQTGGFVRDDVQTRSVGAWIGDVDGVDGADIVLSPVNDKSVTIFKGNGGGVLWQQDIGKPVRFARGGDTDGDGQVEIVALSRDWEVFLFETDGTPVWQKPIAPTAKQTDMPLVGQFLVTDLTGDGQSELVILSPPGSAEDATSTRVATVINGAGEVVWQLPLNVSPRNSTLFAADANADGQSTVTVIDTKQAQGYLLRHDGQLLAQFKAVEATGAVSYADLTNDGLGEIIIGMNTGVQTLTR